MSSFSLAAMAGSSTVPASTTTSSSVIQSDSVPSATSIPPSESSSFTLPAVEDAQTESIKPSKSLTFSDSHVSSSETFRTTSFYDTKAGLSNYVTDDDFSDHADHYSMYGGLDTSFTTEYRHQTSPSVSYVPMLSETVLFEPSSDISETIASTTLTECQESDPYTISSDTSTTQIINDSSSYLYSEIMPSQSIFLFESPPFHTKETDMSKLSGTEKTNILTTKNTYDFHVTVSPYDDFESSGLDDIDKYENISEVKLYEISTRQELYSDITPSKYLVLMESYPFHTKDSDISKLSGSEKTHILTPSSAYDFHVTVSLYDEFESSGLEDIDTYENISEVKLYEISTRQELYSDITPSKSLVLMESFPLHTKDSDMSKLSGSEKTHILTPSSAYDYQVIETLPTLSYPDTNGYRVTESSSYMYDDNVSSGLDDNDTYDDTFKNKFHVISTHSDLYSAIIPSKSLVSMESFPLYIKDKDISNVFRTEKIHISMTESAFYESVDFDDADTNGVIDNDKLYEISPIFDLYSTITPSTSLVLTHSSHIHTKDSDMSKLSGSEKTHILMPSSAYDYQVIATLSYDYDSSGDDENGTYDGVFKEKYQVIPTSSDLYSEIMPSKYLVLMESLFLKRKGTDMSKKSGAEMAPTVSYPDTNGYRVTVLSSYKYDDYESSGSDENDTYDDTFKNKYQVVSTRSDLYSAIIPSKTLVSMESFPLYIKDKSISNVFRTEKIHISVTEFAFYHSVDFDDSVTYEDIDNDKLYDISPVFDMYYTITPSTSLVLTHSSPLHTDDTDMSKLSGSEKKHILTPSSAYDYQVIATLSDNYDSSGDDDNGAYDGVFKEKYQVKSTSSDLYSEILPSKSLVIMESLSIKKKDIGRSKMFGTVTTHTLTTAITHDYQVTKLPNYDSIDVDDAEAYEKDKLYDISTNKEFYSVIMPSKSLVSMKSFPIHPTGDNSELTKTKIDAANDGDVSEEDYNDDENRLGNQSDDKTRDAKQPKEAFSETAVGLWVTFGILVLIVVVVAVFLAVFLWRRRQEQKSNDRMKPNGAATPPGETMDNLKENGAPRENVTFINPAYDI